MVQVFRAYQEFVEPQEESDGAPAAADDFDMMCEEPDFSYESHLHLASQAAVQRKRQMQGRLAFVQDLWNDAERFDAVVASGRYLKLCNLTEWISDYDERAWSRIKNEILAARRAIAVAA